MLRMPIKAETIATVHVLGSPFTQYLATLAKKTSVVDGIGSAQGIQWVKEVALTCNSPLRYSNTSETMKIS